MDDCPVCSVQREVMADPDQLTEKWRAILDTGTHEPLLLEAVGDVFLLAAELQRRQAMRVQQLHG